MNLIIYSTSQAILLLASVEECLDCGGEEKSHSIGIALSINDSLSFSFSLSLGNEFLADFLFVTGEIPVPSLLPFSNRLNTKREVACSPLGQQTDE